MAHIRLPEGMAGIVGPMIAYPETQVHLMAHTRQKRRAAAFKSKVALEAVKQTRTLAELSQALFTRRQLVSARRPR